MTFNQEDPNKKLTFGIPKDALELLKELRKGTTAPPSQAETKSLSTLAEGVFKGKNEREIIQELFENPKLIHVVIDTYSGMFGPTEIWEKGVKIVETDRSKLEKKFNAGSDRSVRYYNMEEKEKVYGQSQLNPDFRARPVLRDFPQGKGYGIVFRTYDYVGREDAGVGYWIIVPEQEKDIRKFLQENPGIPLKVFKEKFLEKSPFFMDPKNKKHEIIDISNMGYIDYFME